MKRKKRYGSGGSSGVKKNVRYRTGLINYQGIRTRFRATIGRSSMTSWRTSGIRLQTLELNSIFAWDEPDKMLADHLWVKVDDIVNREVIDSLLELKTDIIKRIVFSGVVYPYCEPFRGRGFHSFRERFSIGEMRIEQTRPEVCCKEELAC